MLVLCLLLLWLLGKRCLLRCLLESHGLGLLLPLLLGIQLLQQQRLLGNHRCQLLVVLLALLLQLSPAV